MNSDTTSQPAVGHPSTTAVLMGFVARRASSLQAGYQADSPAAVAALAQLRRVVPSSTGLDPYAWAVFDDMPEQLLGHGDLPARAELAAVAALTLFATHQQSRRDLGMHATGHSNSVGQAAGRLKRVTGAPGVERRFRALTRTTDLGSAVQHLRGLVTQLRGERIALDYGAVARDLYSIQVPASVPGVRMRWTRDFHRPARDAEVARQTPSTGDQA